MSQPRRILVVDIRALDNPGFNSSQLSTITTYTDSGNLYFASDVEQIKSAILDVIIHLGSNYRHPLLFDVQILPGDGLDAFIASGNTRSSPRRRDRRRRNN